MDISVIIVNWNTKKLLEACLRSIVEKIGEIGKVGDFTYEVIIVDNGSEDGSQKMVKTKFPKVRLFENSQNLGFSKANNQGIKIAKGKYIFLLNSDTFFVENTLQKLIEHADKTENLGALGPMLLNEDKSIQQSVGFFPNLPQVFWWMSFIDDLPFGSILRPYHVDHDSFYRNDQKVDWITGAAMFIPKSVIEKVGLLDEKIFMYGEDVDWCYRIKNAGFKIFYSPTTKLVHIGRGSAKKVSKNAILGEYKGLIYFYKKHKSTLSLQVLKSLLKIGAIGRILVFTLFGKRETAQFYVEALKVD